MRGKAGPVIAAIPVILVAGTALAALSSSLTIGNAEVLGVAAGFDASYGRAATATGMVAGEAYARDANGNYFYRGIRSTGGGAPTVLPLPSDAVHPSSSGSSYSLAFGIAEAGTAVGSYIRWTQSCATCGWTSAWTAVLWDAYGNVTVLPPGYTDPAGWSYSWAWRISPNGRYVVGQTYFRDADGLSGVYPARWEVGGGPPVRLAGRGYPYGVNDGGVAVGYSWDGTRYRPVRWSADGQTFANLGNLIPEGSTSAIYYMGIAHSIVGDGSSVGYQQIDPDGTGPAAARYYAVRWDAAGTATDIVPGATTAVAYKANDAGMTSLHACIPGQSCRYYIGLDGDFQPVVGLFDPSGLSEAATGTAYFAGHDAQNRAMARWKLSMATPNAAPTVTFATSTVSIAEGTAVVLEPAITDDGPAPLTYEWDITDDGNDDFFAGGATYSFTPTDNGSTTFRVRVTDGAGAASAIATTVVEATNVAPTAVFRASATAVPEGSPFTLSLGSPDDASSSDVVAGFASAFDCGTGAGLGAFSPLRPAGTYTASCSTADDGTRGTYAAIRDKDGGTSSYGPASVVVTNVAPTVTQLILPAAPVALNTTVSASARYTDPGTADTHAAQFTWDWDLGAQAPAAGSVATAATGESGTVTGSNSYAAAGVYTVRVAVTDDDGGTGTRTSNVDVPAYVVVYDPSAGFVTGGGWITSPAGACRFESCSAASTGKASFGFVSRYKRGATTPDGNTEFEFAAGNLRFRSSSYQWLVVSGARGQFKGEGRINGSGTFRFLLTAVDGQVNGGGGVDRLRIRIWRINADGSDGEVVYDNQMDAPDDSDATTALGGGSIVIHGN